MRPRQLTVEVVVMPLASVVVTTPLLLMLLIPLDMELIIPEAPAEPDAPAPATPAVVPLVPARPVDDGALVV